MKREELDAILRRAGEEPPQAPPFREVWNRAVESRRARRPRRRIARAAVAASLVVLLAVVWAWLPGSEPAPGPGDGFDRQAEELARSLSTVRGPLDFLLEPPGGHLFGIDPQEPALRVPAQLSTAKLEEIL